MSRNFSPVLEVEYVHARLSSGRTLIRVACMLAALLAAFRILDHLIEGSWKPVHLLQIGLVFGASIGLAWMAWSPAFLRLYLPCARLVVPVRNAIAAVAIVAAAARGQLELLMILPLMVLGPFFFLGLSYRAGLFSVALTVAAFIVAAVVLGLELPLALRSGAFLLIAAVACAIAARHMDKWSRASFLQSRLIAEQARKDPLTGLQNRRVFDEHLARLWQLATEDRRAIALLLIDVDHFKAYNDRYGHQAGDRTLRHVAKALHALIARPLDVLARYGGEEFGAILYDVDTREAKELAERMREAVKELHIEHRGSRVFAAVTISVGIAVIEPTAERKPRGALQLADEALYEAKVRGRNRVELMDEAAYRMLVTGIFSKTSLAR